MARLRKVANADAGNNKPAGEASAPKEKKNEPKQSHVYIN